ncbi:MAG: hydrogenase maturation nickel metallochaperone HypA [Leptothrix sp. (in: Bacteria)]|nr:hydrogenase maturation nickel metallochaperone HypA [Leptothrix sp. (in: b-proteobacteria)]
MHEMALAESVREIVEGTARANGAHRVSVVRLEIGRLSQVELAAMRFAFEVVQRGSMAEDARLEIVETDGTAWCMPCAQSVLVARRGDPCPACGSHQLQVTGGERMRVLDIEIQ